MQVTKEKMAAQQLVLFHLGFYKGNIDGIWSEATIAAKRKFEAEPSFLPAYPNHGLPFGDRDKLPKGWRYGHKGVIGHTDLSPERAKEIMTEHEARINAASQRAAIKAGEGSVQPQPVGSDGPGVVTETSSGVSDSAPSNTNDPQNVSGGDSNAASAVAGADPSELSKVQGQGTQRAGGNDQHQRDKHKHGNR
jgi:hypothetical protein